MEKTTDLKNLFMEKTSNIPIDDFLINFSLTFILSLLLCLLYIKFGTSFSNRKSFGKNLINVSISTMIVITIVKSSLALSLGLVGALSIVRFRTAIKEPEELSYLFLAITIGLGCGADQREIIIIAFIALFLVVMIQSLLFNKNYNESIYLTISGEKFDLDKVISILKKNSSIINLKRYDFTKEFSEAIFQIEINNFEKFNNSKNEILKLFPEIKISFLDGKNS